MNHKVSESNLVSAVNSLGGLRQASSTLSFFWALAPTWEHFGGSLPGDVVLIVIFMYFTQQQCILKRLCFYLKFIGGKNIELFCMRRERCAFSWAL